MPFAKPKLVGRRHVAGHVHRDVPVLRTIERALPRLCVDPHSHVFRLTEIRSSGGRQFIQAGPVGERIYHTAIRDCAGDVDESGLQKICELLRRQIAGGNRNPAEVTTFRNRLGDRDIVYRVNNGHFGRHAGQQRAM